MMIWRLILLFLILPLPVRADDGLPDSVRAEAWFTGSLASTGANALPEGHFLAEPYLGVASHTEQSFNLLLYGVTDDFTIGLIPRFSWRDHGEIGDVTARVQYRFAHIDDAALAVVVNETLPSGRYDRLNRTGSDGAGGGAYVTQLGLAVEDYVDIDRRPLRLRLDLAYGVATRASLDDRSVYGTAEGFRGSARPGAGFDAVLAFEYSLSTRWGAALDVTYDRSGETHIDGLDFHAVSKVSQSVGLVPALEYNWTPYTGLIVGVQLPAWQRAAPRIVVPLAALNCVF